jgi:methylaspartate mutase epsilon subunit
VKLAVGGLGADSHSVGLFVLVRGLAAAGFDVLDLGIQNEFDRFAAVAYDCDCDAILMSNMDGHARHYLRAVASLPGRCAWYLGGYPTLDGDTRELVRLGFRRVYDGFVDVDHVVAALREDLVEDGMGSGALITMRGAQTPLARRRNRTLASEREAVLAQWSTGAASKDMEANAAVLAERPSLAELQRRRPGEVLLHPRSGVPTAGAQRDLFDTLEEAGADVLSFQVDSLTRSCRYADVERVLREGGELNGFPVVNHGVGTLRQISGESGRVPLQTRHSSSDPRLLAEVSYAGGISSFEGGPISYNLPYYADLPLAVSLDRWRYVDRLSARYAELGIVLDREFFGTLTATLLPPCIPLTTSLLEARLAVEAGVRSVSLAYADQGCRAQDVAALDVLRRLAHELLREHGDVSVAIVMHQYMAAFPPHPGDAEQLIEASAQTAAIARVDRLVVKTPCEATRIPGASDNARGLELAARGIARAAGDAYTRDDAEAQRIEASVRALLRKILALRPGDTGACVEEAFARGLLDVPFSPSRFNAGRLLTVRDLTGAVRVVEPGTMPLPADALAFDRARVAERLRSDCLPRADVWRLVVDDLLRTARGRTAWPLDDTQIYNRERPRRAPASGRSATCIGTARSLDDTDSRAQRAA